MTRQAHLSQGQLQSRHAQQSQRILRPTKLYRLSLPEPGLAISLALVPTGQDEALIASLVEQGQPGLNGPNTGQTDPDQSKQVVAAESDGKQRRASWNPGQLLRFAVTGGLNTLVDILVLNALVWLLAIRSTPLLLACNIVAYCAGAINSFILNKYWTFGQREPIASGELWRFALITISGSLWSSGILWLAGLALQHVLVNPALWTNAAKVVAIGGTALISYLGLRLWVFVQRRPAQRAAGQHLASEQQPSPQRGPSPAEGSILTSETPHVH